MAQWRQYSHSGCSRENVIVLAHACFPHHQRGSGLLAQRLGCSMPTPAVTAASCFQSFPKCSRSHCSSLSAATESLHVVTGGDIREQYCYDVRRAAWQSMSVTLNLTGTLVRQVSSFPSDRWGNRHREVQWISPGCRVVTGPEAEHRPVTIAITQQGSGHTNVVVSRIRDTSPPPAKRCPYQSLETVNSLHVT